MTSTRAEPVTARPGIRGRQAVDGQGPRRPSTRSPQRMMPDRSRLRASWIYVFGVITVAALAVIILRAASLR